MRFTIALVVVLEGSFAVPAARAESETPRDKGVCLGLYADPEATHDPERTLGRLLAELGRLPAHDEGRGVLADFIEEHAETPADRDLVRFLRLHHRLAERRRQFPLSYDRPDYRELLREATALQERSKDAWASRLAEVSPALVLFEGALGDIQSSAQGLPEVVRIHDVAELREELPKVRRIAPSLRAVLLAGSNRGRQLALAEHAAELLPLLAGIPELRVDGDLGRQLAGSALLEGRETLWVRGSFRFPERQSDGGVTVTFPVAELAGSPHTGALRHLRIERSVLFGDEGGARSGLWSRLESLELDQVGMARDARHLRVMVGPELRRLRLHAMQLADATVQALFAAPNAPRLPHLEMLDLSGNPLGSATLRLLFDPARFPKLRHLSLRDCEAMRREESLLALTKMPRLPELRTLDLRGSNASVAVRKALADAPNLKGVELLFD